ncbi:hypothetical protein YTPLAS21_21490 [Candidatus Nitrosocosmicus sp.]|nr:hypothetical protein YTPLAS21_21490 [Candidatus Nitrosocosmicus sp.]
MDTTMDGIPDVAMDTVWAKDFDAGSYHNCNYYVTLSFSKDTNNKYVVYDCDDRGLQEVELWVTDINGNTSFCRTFIDVQDNSGFCPPTIRNSNVSGIISTETTERVENVKVELLNSGRQEIMTNVQGQYAFDQLPTGVNYELRPGKNEGWLNGVTTADIVKIQRHILGLEVFDSPYKMIAADANRSGSITAKDVSELRRLILGVTNEISGNTSWRFIHQLYSFKDVTNALNEPFTESYVINSLQSNMALDFYAVKVGDVNGTAATKGYKGGLQGRSNQLLELEVEDQEVQQGQEVELEVRVKNGEGYRGLQFTLEWPNAMMELIGVEGSQRNKVKEDNYSMQKIQEGKLSFSWEGHMSDGMELIKLKWVIKKGIKLSESLRITDSVTPSLSVGEGGEEGSVVLNYRGMSEGSFVVLPNEPNPWTRTTMVGMLIPVSGEVGISVYDATGKVYLRDRLELTKGYHEYQISRDQLNHAGLYYIQVDFKDRSHTGKMILID